MKSMLKYDLVRVAMMALMSVLCAVYAVYINNDIELIVKSYLFLIPIITFLRNIEYLPKYGMKLVLLKEAIVFLITLTTYFVITIFCANLFYGVPFKLTYIPEIFVLFTMFLVMNILMFIKSPFKKIMFVVLLILVTIIILLMQTLPEFKYMIYVLYISLDILLSIELLIMAKKYSKDIYLKQ